MDFLYTAISWVLLRWHDLFSAIGLGNGSWSWVLSIVFLVITARLLLVRMFVKQVKYQRHMAKMQPKMQKIREKYKNDRAEMQRQMMALQQAEGFNPLAGCLPMFLQIPIFISLYHVLRHLANSAGARGTDLCAPYLAGGKPSHLLSLYSFSANETCSAAKSKLFGAPLAASFQDSGATLTRLGGTDHGTIRVVLVVLLIISAAATVMTQLLVRWNNPVPPEGTAATVQKAMLYLIPLGVLASGLLFNFPLGVLLYWFTSNLWTLGQQAYIIRYHPHEDDDAAPKGEVGKALAPRPGQRPVRMSKGEGAPATAVEEAEAPAAAVARTAPRPGQRPNRPGGAGGKRPAQKAQA
ncbi:MAG: membrane protein insertase YidC, partial [Jatrophihabitans sp.]|uniref:membrane protein insertase YidC n=1 Tax=Jatrophihabitans sp. TaxID=1932789 RepID=UPI003F8121F3